MIRVVVTTVEQMARSWRGLRAGERSRAEARAAALLARVPRARELLVDGYGASRVILFGSLATGDVRETSDVDLAVAGLEPGTYFSALADLMTLFEVPVDLVCLERAGGSLLDAITTEGREL